MNKNIEYILEVEKLTKSFVVEKSLFGLSKKQVKVVEDVSFKIKKGEVFGIVGESGCGKSTTAKLIMKLLEADTGTVKYKDKDILNLNNRELQNMRKDLQIVFQDPFSSLHPRMKIYDLIAEPLIIHGIKSKEKIMEKVHNIAVLVGINIESLNKFPHEFSGGQRQRIAIARALILNPKILICDEAVSALDVSVQNQIINLFNDIKKQMDLTYLFISHDLSVIKYISDRICVMYLGKIVEIGTKNDIFQNSKHPYTNLLMSSILTLDNTVNPLFKNTLGEVLDYKELGNGCRFYKRCSKATEICQKVEPNMIKNDEEHFVACHLYK